MSELIKITSSIKKESDGFEKKLKDIVTSDDNFLKDYLVDFVFSNPKRLRPTITYLLSKILNIKDDFVDNIALSLELIHSASLIHDDILDEAILRRNKQTFYNKFGSKIAVLEGDFLLSSALEILSNCPKDIIKIFSKKIKETLLGELNQNSNLNKIQTVDDYINKNLSKTTNLFLAGLESLFCLKTVDEKTKDSLLNFLKNYSIAFQIKNDIANIENENSSDIKCGNYTLPVIYFCLENDIKEFRVEDFNSKKAIYIAKTLKKVEEYKNLSIKFLENIENSIYKEELVKLCEFTLRS